MRVERVRTAGTFTLDGGSWFSDRGQILASIRDRLLTLDDATVVHTGHGDDTTIGAERAGVEAALREARA